MAICQTGFSRCFYTHNDRLLGYYKYTTQYTQSDKLERYYRITTQYTIIEDNK